MKKKEEIKQLNKLWKKAKKHLKSYLISGEQEELHQFRVRTKKIKAMLTLYSASPENQNLLKTFKPVKKVFQKAGEIRSAFINLKLGDKHQLHNETFKQHQEQLLHLATEEFKNERQKHLKRIKKVHIRLQNNINHLKNDQIIDFFQEKLSEIESFFERPTFDDELHNTRKKIKLLVYNRKLPAKALRDKLNLNYEYLDQLQNLIGNWHDHHLTIEVFSNLGKAEDKAIHHLEKSNTNLEQEIAEKGKDFRKKVTDHSLETGKN